MQLYILDGILMFRVRVPLEELLDVNILRESDCLNFTNARERGRW